MLGQSTRRFPLPLSDSQFVRQRPRQEQLVHQYQRNRFIDTEQVRFRRHDRSSAFAKPRPKTKKQRQDYNRRMKKQANEAARHSPPGSKAGPRRQWAKERWQQLLDYGKRGESTALVDPTVSEQYTIEDALLEDIMGNTSHLTSQPTPQPVYLGHRHKAFFNKVANQMDAYREYLDAAAATDSSLTSSSSSSQSSTLSPIVSVDLPSDKDISKVLRAYRDRHGTRNKPIGIVTALRHILQDLGVPTVAFGENTYTALLTCCRTPQEARRIFKLMTQNNQAISSYSWSILVDVHGKVGDFEGCSQVIKEMSSHGGHPPSQAAYTSLLAACYRVCNDGRIPHAIRAEAGKVGWTHWQQMRIVGIEPDAMAYGAIIRLCAARGHPERAINLLEDMQRFDVKPTTLCFSGALKAVAKSHEIAVRFENGSSPKQLKRESNASHHGKMARRIVILAEAAEIEQDEGFISALMLCAAAAGDSATSKAIFLASEVRRMDNLRTIGSNTIHQLSSDEFGRGVEKLEASTGHPSDTVSIVPGSPSERFSPAVSYPNDQLESVPSFGEREYGKDTRTLSALLHASAQAMNRNGLGTMWAGRENQGYLCENSLRLITTRWEPSYKDTSVPGVSSTKVGIGLLRRVDERERDEDPKPGKRKKFRGLYIDSDDATTVDDLNEQAILRSTGEMQNYVTENDFFSSERPNLPKDVLDSTNRLSSNDEVSILCFSSFRVCHPFCTLPDWMFLWNNFPSLDRRVARMIVLEIFCCRIPCLKCDSSASTYMCLLLLFKRFVPFKVTPRYTNRRGSFRVRALQHIYV
jgi:pentatricopeptide repeat protein